MTATDRARAALARTDDVVYVPLVGRAVDVPGRDPWRLTDAELADLHARRRWGEFQHALIPDTPPF